MKLRACCLIVALGVAAVPTALAQQPNLRLTRIGDSTAVRLTWDPLGTGTGAGDDYEISRFLNDGAGTTGWEVIGHAAIQPETQVFVDDQPKKVGARYHYSVAMKSQGASTPSPLLETSIVISSPPNESKLIRHALFDDNRLHLPFSKRPAVIAPKCDSSCLPKCDPACVPKCGSTWKIENGKLTWIRTQSNSNDRLVLEATTGKATQIIARVQVDVTQPAPDQSSKPRVGVGILSEDGKRLHSLVLHRFLDPTGNLKLQLYQEADLAKPTPLPLSDAVTEKSWALTGTTSPWIWLKLRLTKDKIEGKAWLDGTQQEKDAVTVEGTPFDLSDFKPEKAVLIGGDEGLLASFGEIYIEELAQQADQAAVPNGEPGQATMAENTTTPAEDPKREAFKDLWEKGFDGLPTVIRLVRRGSLPLEESLRSDELVPRLEEVYKEARAFDFPSSARFTIPRFDRKGGEFEDDGAVIYEGMRFVVEDSGNYEVRFLVSTPAMPVLLRLQLHVPCTDRGEHTITLPPIDLPPYTNAKGHYEAATWKVRHVGHSPIIARAGTRVDKPWVFAWEEEQARKGGGETAETFKSHVNDKPDGLDHLVSIRRSGTARFGSVPEPAN